MDEPAKATLIEQGAIWVLELWRGLAILVSVCAWLFLFSRIPAAVTEGSWGLVMALGVTTSMATIIALFIAWIAKRWLTSLYELPEARRRFRAARPDLF